MSKPKKKSQKEKPLRKKEMRLYKKAKAYIPLLLSLLASVVPLLEATKFFFSRENFSGWDLVLFIAASLIAFINALVLYAEWRSNPTYEYLRKADCFSKATLEALKEAEQKKKRFILQSTYGRVPEWHPIDYRKNILVYDVHEQIRSILIELQRIIINSGDGFSDHNVNVDFVYCYPDKEYPGDLPYPPYTCGKYNDERWRIITCGNHSAGGSIKKYLGKSDSFYYYVDLRGYVFENDKTNILNTHYCPSIQDNEHSNQGSIVGVEIELRNDTPEAVFVKGILTITTYGKKLYENEPITEDQFKDIFKEKVLNSFCAMLKSELSQMYIRHAIRDGHMCPNTGKMKNQNDKKQREENHCKFSKNKKCWFHF